MKLGEACDDTELDARITALKPNECCTLVYTVSMTCFRVKSKRPCWWYRLLQRVDAQAAHQFVKSRGIIFNSLPPPVYDGR